MPDFNINGATFFNFLVIIIKNFWILNNFSVEKNNGFIMTENKILWISQTQIF